jgi:mRNA-degrading endonuclease toxin of MazEF toxin-antitoxin module
VGKGKGKGAESPKRERVFVDNISRGEIYWVDVRKDETRGEEQFKERPWLIVSSDAIHRAGPIVLAVPLSTQLHRLHGHENTRFLLKSTEVERLT